MAAAKPACARPSCRCLQALPRWPSHEADDPISREAEDPISREVDDPVRARSDCPGGMTMAERLRLNPIACEAHGMCAELLPERIALDEWGYPLVDGTPL